jgi:hypothetical protein
MRPDPATEQALSSTVDRLFDSMAARQLEETLAAFIADESVALYGSEVSEVVIGQDALRDFFERLYAKPHGPRFTLKNPRWSVGDRVAWFTAEAEVRFGDQVVTPYRLTGILEKSEGKWRWALFNGSEPLPDR